MSYVYFITEQSCKKSPGKPLVKIGLTRNIAKRLEQMQTGNPRKLSVVMMIGPMSRMQAANIERSLHGFFKDSQVRGEWFDRSVIKRLAKTGDRIIPAGVGVLVEGSF